MLTFAITMMVTGRSEPQYLNTAGDFHGSKSETVKPEPQSQCTGADVCDCEARRPATAPKDLDTQAGQRATAVRQQGMHIQAQAHACT